MQLIPAFRFTPEFLTPLALQYAETFQSAKPYQHVVIDNFLPVEVADLIAAEYPKPYDIQWTYSGPGLCRPIEDKPYLNKLSVSNEDKFPPFIRHVMHEFNSMSFIFFLEAIAGVKGIIPDHTYSGCGLHSTGRGGRLLIHIDQSRHPNKRLDQMLNMIYFCTKDWREEYHGHLELWNANASVCERRIAPEFNRLVVFNTGTNTFHGHPVPLECPEDVRRNSLSVYYYLLDRPRDATYIRRCDSVGWVAHTPEDRDYALQKMAEQPSAVIPGGKYLSAKD